MKLIAHRGLMFGSDKTNENAPYQIESALDKGFDAEIDLRIVNDKFFLGHDEPTYEIEESFLENTNFWCHAKNLESLQKMLSNSKIHCFWHQDDDYTLTSRGIIWTYPGKTLTLNSICVLPEWVEQKEINCLGICSDYIENYK